MSSSTVCFGKADYVKFYFSLCHHILLSHLLTPASFSLPTPLFSHTRFSSFPSTTLCPRLGSVLHQSVHPSPSCFSSKSVFPPSHCSPFILALSYFDLDTSSLIPACVHLEPATSLPNRNQTSLPTTRKLQRPRVIDLLPSAYHRGP